MNSEVKAELQELKDEAVDIDLRIKDMKEKLKAMRVDKDETIDKIIKLRDAQTMAALETFEGATVSKDGNTTTIDIKVKDKKAAK